MNTFDRFVQMDQIFLAWTASLCELTRVVQTTLCLIANQVAPVVLNQLAILSLKVQFPRIQSCGSGTGAQADGSRESTGAHTKPFGSTLA